jgi:restriction system protein
MKLWVVRAGRYGEQEEGALQYNVATIGWNELTDLSSVRSKEALRELYEKAYPAAKKMTIANEVGQIWRFVDGIQPDDLIILPLKLRPVVAIGRVTGPYQYREDLSPNIRHVRPVQWLNTDLPRPAFDLDIFYSFGRMTVCQVRRNEKKVLAILKGEAPTSSIEDEPGIDELDIEEVANAQIREYLIRKFKSHDMARLVEAILQSQGYVTALSEPGPDGGVDILAGAGPMGFDSPRL